MYKSFQPDPRQEAAARRLEAVLAEGYWALLEYLQSGLDPDLAELVATRIILTTAEERLRSRFRLYLPKGAISSLTKRQSPTRAARLVLEAMEEYLGERPTKEDYLAQCRAEGVSEDCAKVVWFRRK